MPLKAWNNYTTAKQFAWWKMASIAWVKGEVWVDLGCWGAQADVHTQQLWSQSDLQQLWLLQIEAYIPSKQLFPSYSRNRG